MKWPGCRYCRGNGCMHCPDARDADLYELVQNSQRGGAPRGGGGGVPIVVGMSLDEYEARREHAQKAARRAMLAEIEALLPAEPEVSAELKHAREMLAQWSEHAAGANATRYAIEQRGHWRRRVAELEPGPVKIAEAVAPGKVVRMPRPAKRRAKTKRRAA